MKYKYIVFCFYLLILSCKSTKNSNSVVNTYPDEVKEYLNETNSIQILPNIDNTLYLYLFESSISSASPTKSIKFVVFDKNENKVIYKNQFSNSLLKWQGHDELLLTQYLGIIENQSSSNIKHFIIRPRKNEIIETININPK